MNSERALRARLEQAGQQALIQHVELLEEPTRDNLVHQIENIDWDLVQLLREGHALAHARSGAPRPLPYVRAQDRPAEKARRRGRQALEQGKVAFALMAGGQASRLNLDGPKGCFPIGPTSDRSLFRVFVEHIRRAGQDYGRLPPLAVTTSLSTDAAIRMFFELADCFGMDRDSLYFARQGSLPALDDDGNLMLARPDRLFLSPDGHGGALAALSTEGILASWKEQGIEVVCTFQVDNPLLSVVDEDFVGRLLEHRDRAPIATKIVLKTDPAEKVGVVASVGGRPAIVEYSEISEEQAGRRDKDGQLTFRLGSIAAHAFDLDFLLKSLRKPLPLHAARKQIPCVDAEGKIERHGGTKYERFLFDLFPRAPGITVVEVDRAREYAAVKNAEGKDSPELARAAMQAEYRRWYEEAGVALPEEPLELSPLDVLGPEDVKAFAERRAADA